MTGDKLDEAAVAAAWDRNAERWTEDVRAGHDLFRDLYTFPAFLAFMPPIDGLRVIDLGCGEGSNTRRFAKLGGRLTGIDLSRAMIRHARAQEAAEPLGVRYEVGSFRELSGFEDGSFDCALSTMALMDSPDFPSVMRAVHRVIRPGGSLCFSVLHPCFLTPALEWLHDESGGSTGLRVGRYFDQGSFVEHWRFSKRPNAEAVRPFEVPRFPRTLSDYLNPVIDAGFKLAKIDEPRPDAERSANHPRLARWREHAPLVLFVAATKV